MTRWLGSRPGSLGSSPATAKALVTGLSGFRSVVAYVPGLKTALLAIGPQGTDVSADDGRTWTKVEGPGFDTFSFVRGAAVGWGAGARGTIGLFRN